MKLQYDKNVIEQALNYLNGMTVSGLRNFEQLAAVSMLLGQYVVVEEETKEGEADDR